MTETEKLGYLELLLVLSNKFVSEKDVIGLFDWKDLSVINLEVMVWLTKGLIMQNSLESSEIAKSLLIYCLMKRLAHLYRSYSKFLSWISVL